MVERKNRQKIKPGLYIRPATVGKRRPIVLFLEEVHLGQKDEPTVTYVYLGSLGFEFFTVSKAFFLGMFELLSEDVS